jgi:hypothetical protein
VRRKSRPIDEHLHRCVNGACRNLTISMGRWIHDGLEGALFGVALPFPQHFESEMFVVRIDGLAVLLAQPDAVVMVTRRSLLKVGSYRGPPGGAAVM